MIIQGTPQPAAFDGNSLINWPCLESTLGTPLAFWKAGVDPDTLGGRTMSRFATLVLATAASLGAAAMPVAAQDEFRDARIRYSEGGATLQRASEPAAEEAVANVLILPGDRIWTDGRGRVELQFADGSFVRLDSRSKLDFVSHDEGRADRVVLRLWSGALMLHAARRGAASFAIETPAGLVEASDGTLLRVDFEDGEARVSVLEGGASLEGSRGRLSTRAGERSYLSRGEAPETARTFDSRRTDDFDDWSAERDSREVFAEGNRRSLPPEVSPYEGELEANGSWYYMSEVGNVWRPSVDAGWQPYVNGRWDWSSYGWAWVAGEPWGWATSHYGRWGYAGGIGWYWIPGSVWAPAWVSWAVGNDYVGWCPLGYGDVPVSRGHGQRGSRGYAVPRGSAADAGSSNWIYARKSDLQSTRRGATTREPRVRRRPGAARGLAPRPPHARPPADRRGPAAVPRAVNIKPTIGDFVPELAGDNLTSIPVRAPEAAGAPAR